MTPTEFDERPDHGRHDDERRRYDRSPSERMPAQRNGMATASLVLGILSICGGITSLPGIICGIIGISRAKERGRGGMATAGLVLSIAGLVLVVPATLIALLLPAVQKVRESAARMQSSNNLKMISLAMSSYDAANGRLPPQAICDKNGKKLLSWRVELLPYLEYGNLHQQFRLDEPWDSPTNKALIPFMPKMYARAGADPKRGETPYKVFAGKKTAFTMTDETARPSFVNSWSLNSLISSPRGARNVIICAEAGDPVIWTKPDDVDYDPNAPLPDFKPQYSGGFLVVMGDGRVITVRKGYREAALRGSIDPYSSPTELLDP